MRRFEDSADMILGSWTGFVVEVLKVLGGWSSVGRWLCILADILINDQQFI